MVTTQLRSKERQVKVYYVETRVGCLVIIDEGRWKCGASARPSVAMSFWLNATQKKQYSYLGSMYMTCLVLRVGIMKFAFHRFCSHRSRAPLINSCAPAHNSNVSHKHTRDSYVRGCECTLILLIHSASKESVVAWHVWGWTEWKGAGVEVAWFKTMYTYDALQNVCLFKNVENSRWLEVSVVVTAIATQKVVDVTNRVFLSERARKCTKQQFHLKRCWPGNGTFPIFE